MRVYVQDEYGQRLVGRADIPNDAGPIFEVPLFGGLSVIREQFIIGAVTRVGKGETPPAVERAVLLAPGQPPELLPGWQPLAS